MTRFLSICTLLTAALLQLACASGEKQPWRQIPLDESRLVGREPREVAFLSELAEAITREAVEEKGAGHIALEETWTTIIDARDPRDPRIGSWQGETPVYPASIVKLCYMVTAFDQIEMGLLRRDSAFEKEMTNMMVVSGNAATNAVLDRIANTGYGPTLTGDAKESFEWKRRVSARHMRQLGLDGLFPINKTYDGETPFYGRDVAALGERVGDNYENSNMMTTGDTARLLYMLATRSLVSRAASEEMLDIIRRDEKSKTLFSKIVPAGVTLYSKSGSAGPCRHDAGIFELPEGGFIVVVSFSKIRPIGETKPAETPEVIERVAELALERLRKTSGELDNATRDRVPGASNR